MGEIKQTNFRIDTDSAEIFRKYCDENDWNQAQGFAHLVQVIEMDRAKAALPTRTTEIENFEKSVKDIMAAYLYSLEVNEKAEGRIREQFVTDLERKDKTIDDLRIKAEQLQAEKDAVEAAAAEAVKAKDQAEKDAAAAEKVRVAAEKTAEDKQTIADTLAAKLAEAEKKAEGFDDLKAALIASQDAEKAAEQRLKDIQRDAAEAAKDAAREAERAKDQAVKELSDTMQAQLSALRDELRVSKSETDSARRDAETAKTAAIAELSQAHRAEVAEIRTKLDARTEALMQARQQSGDTQILLQKEQAKTSDLERQLKAALAEIANLKADIAELKAPKDDN